MTAIVTWIRNHRLITFFGLTYAIAWWSWPFYALGIAPDIAFLPVAPLAAAIIVIAIAEGKAGFRDLGSRIIRWRVPWYWYAVAIGVPLAVRFGTVFANAGLGGSLPDWSSLAWTSFLMAFLIRLVNPMDGPLGEEPGFRGFAIPRLQARWSPLASVTILAVLVALWHLPLVVTDNIGPVGLITTFSITFFYFWLFNRTGGSVLLTLLAHMAQGAVKFGDFGLPASDLARQEWMECVVWSAIAVGLVVFDRSIWRTAPEKAVFRLPATDTALTANREPVRS
jgi:membrane protease YdiL (CAAX protease family)